MQKRDIKAEPLAFVATLPTSGRRQAFALDGEGAGTLVLEIPESEAQRVAQRFHELRDRAFFVTIVLKAES